MKPVVIIRHVENEGPGYLADFLDHNGIPRELVRIDRRERLPDDVTGLSGLVFMGGPMSVNDGLPWIPQALALIRRALDTGVPVLGHCLGGQLIAKALGAAVTRNPAPEFGWLPVNTVNDGAERDWLDRVPAEFTAFHWHGEAFELPAGATRILASEHCANQGFVIGNTLALQCHIEMTADMVRDWLRTAGDTLPPPSASVQRPSAMLEGLDENIRRMQAVADRLYARWTRGLN